MADKKKVCGDPPIATVSHALVGTSLIREREGIVARCQCGWSSGGHFSSMGASAAMSDHRGACERQLTTCQRPEASS